MEIYSLVTQPDSLLMCGAATAPARTHGARSSGSCLISADCVWRSRPSPRLRRAKEQSNGGLLDFGNSQFSQIIERRIVEARRASGIVYVAGRNEHDHTLSRAREQNPVRVAQINAVVRIRDVAPTLAAEIVIIPS